MSDNSWFTEVGGEVEIEQGDIVVSCNVILPSDEHYMNVVNNVENDLPLDVIEINCIILSQSCDIANDKIDSVIICPIISLRNLINKIPYFSGKEARESLRQGREPAYHLLNKVSLADGDSDFYVVVFRHIYSIPKSFIKAIVRGKQRKRLLPPYREHLSQSFARYFMRVGLPADIDKEAIKYYDPIIK
jgi:hypothetical protein